MTLIAGLWDIWLGNENTFLTLWMMGGLNIIFTALKIVINNQKLSQHSDSEISEILFLNNTGLYFQINLNANT